MEAITSRQRVLKTIAHQEPDRVPFNMRIDAKHWERFRKEFGPIDFAEHLAHDIRYVCFPLPNQPPNIPNCEWIPLPDTDAIRVTAETVNNLQKQGLAVCSGYHAGIYEQAKSWLGDEATLIGPYENPVKFMEMLEKITDWKCALHEHYVRAGVDIVWTGDDLGTQRSLVMSPDMYRQWYRPFHRRLVNHLRDIRSDIKIAFHCCGYVTPLIPDLIDIGFDVLEAVQSECMNIAELKREFGRDLVFWGAVGAQSVMQLPKSEMMKGIQKTLQIMSPGGGYIASPCHTITEEVSWENILAFHEAMHIYGTYSNPGKLRTVDETNGKQLNTGLIVLNKLTV